MCYHLGERLFIIDLWVDEGFAGQRAAVELAHDAENLAKSFNKRLLFDIPVDNERFMKVVSGVGYAPTHITFEREI
jgi:hypothetical protein